jgi:hypothetical protein
VPFVIECDASSSGIGAVLLQEGHPLAFVSKALGTKTKGLSTYKKEYLAIILAVTQWRQYLQHSEFLIYTDHRSLSHLTEKKLHTPWQQKMFSKLLELQYRVVYKKGMENGAVDALSRRPINEVGLYSISSLVPDWLVQVLDSYNQDPFLKNCCLNLLYIRTIHHLIPYSQASFVTRDEYGWGMILSFSMVL